MQKQRHPHRFDDQTYHDLRGRIAMQSTCKDRIAFFAAAKIRAVVAYRILEACKLWDTFVIAMCVMPDHLHLLVDFEKARKVLPKFMQDLKKAIAFDLCFAGRYIDRSVPHSGPYGDGPLPKDGPLLAIPGPRKKVLQRSYFDRHARNDEDIDGIIQYILANPIRKGLCESWEDWVGCYWCEHPRDYKEELKRFGLEEQPMSD